jgi:hypothetical protein
MYTSRLLVRCDGSQQYPRKLSTKKISRFFIDCLHSLHIFYYLTNRVNMVVKKRPCRQTMSSYRMDTIGSKSGISISRLPHFQGFVEQKGKGICIYTCSLLEKYTTRTWTSRGDIDSIPLHTYREITRNKPSRSSSKSRGTRTRRQSEKDERM